MKNFKEIAKTVTFAIAAFMSPILVLVCCLQINAMATAFNEANDRYAIIVGDKIIAASRDIDTLNRQITAAESDIGKQYNNSDYDRGFGYSIQKVSAGTYLSSSKEIYNHYKELLYENSSYTKKYDTGDTWTYVVKSFKDERVYVSSFKVNK